MCVYLFALAALFRVESSSYSFDNHIYDLLSVAPYLYTAIKKNSLKMAFVLYLVPLIIHRRASYLCQAICVETFVQLF